MAKLLKLRRGTTSQHSSFTGAEGEVTVDTDKETLVVHDGSTAGGHPVAAEDMANVSSASIAGRLGTDSIATTKIAAGALPTDVTIADANISGNLTIASADIVDEAITLAKLEHGTSSNNGKFLRANNGADPTFEVVNTDLVADTSPQLGGDLASNGNDILMGDNDEIKLGAGGDLKLEHQSSSGDSFITEVGGGNLIIQGSNFIIRDAGTAEKHIEMTQNGSVDLYYDAAKKLETVTGGVTVTGTLTATAFAGDGSALTGIAGIPSGVIAIWSGATAAIPSGWVICDGQNSTPDLRDRFVVGATASGDNPNTSFPGVSVGHTGGGFSGSMTISVNGNTGWASQYSNASSNPNASPEPFNSRDRHQHGWGGNFPHSYDKTPPFHALAFIMKT